MKEVTIGQHAYRIGKLNAFKQLHIVRRLSPCLGKLAGLAGEGPGLKRDAQGNPVDVEGGMEKLLEPLANAMAALSDDDVEYVLHACLEVTDCRQGAGWARMRANGSTMFDSLSLPVLLQLAFHVLRENLTDFFTELPPGSLGGMGSKPLHG